MNIGMIYSSIKYITNFENIARLSFNIFETTTKFFGYEIIKNKFTRSVTKQDIIVATYLIKYIDDKRFLGYFLRTLKYGSVNFMCQFTELFINNGIQHR